MMYYIIIVYLNVNIYIYITYTILWSSIIILCSPFQIEYMYACMCRIMNIRYQTFLCSNHWTVIINYNLSYLLPYLTLLNLMRPRELWSIYQERMVVFTFSPPRLWNVIIYWRNFLKSPTEISAFCELWSNLMYTTHTSCMYCV